MSDAVHKVVTEVTGVFTSLILLIQHGEDAYEKLKGWTGLRTFIERRFGDRRKYMSLIQEIQVLMSLVPKLEKAVTDAKALEGSPQGAQLIADIEAIITEAKTLVPSTNVAPVA